MQGIFPLKIEKANFVSETLILSGRDWSLSTLSAWRVTEDGRIVYGCFDEGFENKVSQLAGLEVVDIFFSNKNQDDDPSFVLSDGKVLEVFSSIMVEPWVLKLPSVGIFTGKFE